MKRRINEKLVAVHTHTHTHTDNLKNNKGITLVALVITIILLLILAGITISQLTGSGLFENAKLAEQKSKEAQEKEYGILGDYENQISEYIDGTRNANANNYSIDEIEIGTWVDGKKLYRKVIVYNQNITSQVTLLDVSELDIDTFVNYGGSYLTRRRDMALYITSYRRCEWIRVFL